MLQPGADLIPLDSAGESINDETYFLDTWEVSQRDTQLKDMRFEPLLQSTKWT